MSVLVDVLDAVRAGVPAPHLGAWLGVDDGLAEAALDHWVRLGFVTPAGELALGCTACGGEPDPARPRAPSCTGCPFGR